MARRVVINGNDVRQAMTKPERQIKIDWRLQYMRGRSLVYGSQDPQEQADNARLMERYA